MLKIDMAANRKYMVSNAWLDKYKNDKKRFVDILEIAKEAEKSQYLKDLIDMGVTVEFGQEAQKAAFLVNGLRVGLDDDGTQIDGVMLGENPLVARFQNNYAALVNHPERFRRFYAQGTQVRNLMWVGLDKTSHIYNT